MVELTGDRPSNPFTPSFGVSPQVLGGRERLVAEFTRGLGAGPGHPARATLYVGARGTGKTVLLNTLEDEAHERGWRTVPETASPGLSDRLAESHLPRMLAAMDPRGRSSSLTGLSTPAGGVSWTSTETHSPKADLRSQLADVADLLAGSGSGLLVTVDEIGPRSVEELRELMVAFQHMFREGRQVALAAAGLPSGVAAAINAEGLTFLQRAARHELGELPMLEVERTLALTAELGDRRFDTGALTAAAEVTAGYPFMIQLVGYHAWELATGSRITDDDVQSASQRAGEDLGRLVYEPTLKHLAPKEVAFLEAMAADDGPSAVADLAKRLGRDRNWVNYYRSVLIQRRVIEPAGRGLLAFVGPFMREYVRERAG